MKKIIFTAGLLIVIMFQNYSFGQNSFLQKDTLAMLKISRDFESAFNAHNAKALANLFLLNAEFTNVVAASVKGRKAIEDFHETMFMGKPGYFSFKNSTLKNEIPKISFIKPDVASVDIFWTMDHCLLPDGSELKNRKGLITLLLVKTHDQWGIAVMHNAELSSNDKQ